LLQADCLYTGSTPGPTLGIEYGKAFTFYLYNRVYIILYYECLVRAVHAGRQWQRIKAAIKKKKKKKPQDEIIMVCPIP